MTLWSNEVEIQFFKEALKNFASPEQLFYKLSDGYYAYIPKGHDSEGHTLQSRNSLIGKFTEKWCKNLLEPIAKKLRLFAVNNVVCNEIGLTQKSSADLALCKSDSSVQEPENIKLIFEIKMSIVSNYKYLKPGKIIHIGNYNDHKGNPSLLRSDSMLKAIGKAINIRVSGRSSSKIPIVILGNTPITNSYINKVDFLKSSGVIQGFLSLNPNKSAISSINETPGKGFQTLLNRDSLLNFCGELISSELNYFSTMVSKKKLGEIIRLANKENTDIAKADKFLSIIQSLR